MRRTSLLLAVCFSLGALAEPPPADEPDPDDDVEEAAPPATTSTAKARKADELTDEEAGGVVIGLCCCSLGFLGLVGVVIWALRRGSKQPGAAAAASGPAPGAMQLSIFALGLEPQARAVVEEQLAQLAVDPVPATPETRGRLVREVSRALLTVQPSWKQFGYGEKPGLTDLPSAESSYRSASDDFRARAAQVNPAASGLVVVTLLICSKRGLIGVSRLDDPTQVRTVLEDRMRVLDGELLGAELLWAPLQAGACVSEAEIALRFPEMLPLIPRAI
jgi:uncharacterized membrane protein